MSVISAIMSTYCRNRAGVGCPNLLRRAINSVLTQTFKDWELVLIDDGSTDGSEKVCREYAARDKRIRYVRCKENSGLPARRYNDGMKMAKAHHFMFMFDDDYWYPNAMKCLVEARDKYYSGCGMVYGLTDIVELHTGRTYKGFGFPFDLKMMRERNILGNLSVMVSRKAINAVGGYEEDPLFRRLCDWDLWVRIGKQFKVGRVGISVGCSTSMNPDSIGMTVPLTPEDRDRILVIQDEGKRKVRLQGEL